MPVQLNGNLWAPASPYQHGLSRWPVQCDALKQTAISAGATSGTDQGHAITSWPYFWLYDIVISYTASSNDANGRVDVYNAITSGASWMKAAYTVATNASTLQKYSALFAATPNLSTKYNPYLSTSSAYGKAGWLANNVYPYGTVFSVRATTTASTGSITGLSVTILGFASDDPQFEGI